MADLVLDAVHWKDLGNGSFEWRETPLPVASKDDVRLGTPHLDGAGNARMPSTGHVENGYRYDTNDNAVGTLQAGGSPPTVPALSIADNGLGTGATALVSGGDAGATNSIYVMPMSSSTWALSGQRSGNGEVALTLDPGRYWGRVVSVLGGTATGHPIAFEIVDHAAKKGLYRVTGITRTPGQISMRLSLEKIERPIRPQATVE